MNIMVSITPGLSPIDRGSIEDAMLDALGSEADFAGGGTALGQIHRSGFTIVVPETRKVDDVAAICQRVLEEVEFHTPTEVILRVGREEFEIQTRHVEYFDTP